MVIEEEIEEDSEEEIEEDSEEVIVIEEIMDSEAEMTEDQEEILVIEMTEEVIDQKDASTAEKKDISLVNAPNVNLILIF